MSITVGDVNTYIFILCFLLLTLIHHIDSTGALRTLLNDINTQNGPLNLNLLIKNRAVVANPTTKQVLAGRGIDYSKMKTIEQKQKYLAMYLKYLHQGMQCIINTNC